jgi:hypothetical protein
MAILNKEDLPTLKLAIDLTSSDGNASILLASKSFVSSSVLSMNLLSSVCSQGIMRTLSKFSMKSSVNTLTLSDKKRYRENKQVSTRRYFLKDRSYYALNF